MSVLKSLVIGKNKKSLEKDFLSSKESFREGLEKEGGFKYKGFYVEYETKAVGSTGTKIRLGKTSYHLVEGNIYPEKELELLSELTLMFPSVFTKGKVGAMERLFSKHDKEDTVYCSGQVKMQNIWIDSYAQVSFKNGLNGKEPLYSFYFEISTGVLEYEIMKTTIDVLASIIFNNKGKNTKQNTLKAVSL